MVFFIDSTLSFVTVSSQLSPSPQIIHASGGGVKPPNPACVSSAFVQNQVLSWRLLIATNLIYHHKPPKAA